MSSNDGTTGGNNTRSPKFPQHAEPRVWFLTPGHSPISISLARNVLRHGDYVVTALLLSEFDAQDGRSTEFKAFLDEVREKESWRLRLKIVGMDISSIGECQAAIAEAIEAFGKIDILICCNSEAIIGTVEELSPTPRIRSLISTQFTTNFFGPVNLIKSILPHFRANHSGHLILLTGITGHLGTPGLSIYCASQWAIEGYCDSLAYETAPFNIRMSIVQSNFEIAVLTNRLTSVPPMGAYMPPANPAPLSRGIIAGLLDRLDNAVSTSDGDPSGEGRSSNGGDASSATAANIDTSPTSLQSPGTRLLSPEVSTLYPPLPPTFRDRLVAETVHAVLAIGGHANPPARHIVGFEGVAAVKEKLKTVTEELEDFVEVSNAVDL